MKKIASAVLALFVLGLAASVAFGQASVPNLINFQGRLADTSGVPIADGPHNLTFAIYSLLSGGSTLWSEAASVTTKDGVFTHQLGSVAAFSQTLFQSYDSLYLEITVEGEIISPRTLLTSVPYTRLSNNLEVRSTANDTVVVRSIPSDRGLSSYGTDGTTKMRLWCNGLYGIIYLYDDANSDQTVRLAGNSSSGGELNLYQEDATAGVNLRGGSTVNGATLSMYSAAGSPTISLDADLTGTSAAVLPADAISDLEIADEPGVASNANSDGVAIASTALAIILSRTITVPAAGYVLVLGTTQFEVTHVTGTSDTYNIGVSGSSTALPVNQDLFTTVIAALPTGTYQKVVSPHGLFVVPAGANTFYLLGEKVASTSVNATAFDSQLSLVYFPTAYGTVVGTFQNSASEQDDGAIDAPDRERAASMRQHLTDEAVSAEQAEAASFNSARLEKELAEIKAQRAELEARIQRLEKQVDQTGPTQEIE
ncbi:MAG: hypothetical protein A2142_06030 [candidate division Zixibacteria bacterium RBG_16_48_11]|nr:MAG: hypothetical protein A2142_06030 [candidate division Zixibacteria bacterium RBG_16_48_11]